MKIGITYDTGFFPGARPSRAVFRREQVRFDMQAIARELGCPAVRITGGDLERLRWAGRCAADAGLDVWFSPFPCELEDPAMTAFLAESAAAAEELRRQAGTNVVFVAGCEASVFGSGFLPGDDVYARLRLLSAPTPELFAEYPQILARFNAFLAEAADAVRARFAGPVTYASGAWEQVDWTPFDIVGVDAYRDEANRETFAASLQALAGHGKPVAATEFGCCTYRGAAARGGSGWMIVEGAGADRRLDGDWVRDEDEQVRYLREVAEVYEQCGLEAAFWFTFASWNRPAGEGRRDLDVASFGVVRVLDEGAASPEACWERKAVFEELARRNGRS
ncbi:MAG: hypothetical protein GC160_07600 [Acidobacteria bacterium]|nr:hypothetical protein [Acidobacteriota bacterium]